MSSSGKILYLEIKKSIEKKIRDGEFSLGDQLPSEPRLSEIYNASRGTIRQALSTLEREGIIARRSGVGTLVVRKPKSAAISSFTQQVINKGKLPSTRVLEVQIIKGHEALGRVLEAFPKCCDEKEPEPIFCVRRLRFANDQPVALQTIYLRVADFGARNLEEEDFTQSLFKFYARFHRHPVWADETIRAKLPTKKDIQFFQMESVPAGEKFLYMRERITYDNENLPLEVLESIERGDFFNVYQYRLMADVRG